MFARAVRWFGPFVVVLALAGVPRLSQHPAVQQQPIGDAVDASTDQIAAPAAVVITEPRTAKRPALLAPLWGSYIGLQALDIHSTRTALSSGAGREGNPVMAQVAQSSGAMIAVKAASTAAVIFGTEKLWKKNRVAAVVSMVAVNSAMALVVRNNYGVAR